MKKGKLIVFEGISGTGKETQARLLQEHLKKQSVNAVIIYHPSTDLKTILFQWRKERKIDSITEVYLLLADRYDHVRRVINPALEKGQWVISLRNWVSALVYQGTTDKERQWMADEFGRFEPKPDFLFYFDIEPAAAYIRALARHKQTGEPMGKFETSQCLAKMRHQYRTVLKRIPHRVIDASQSIDGIYSQIVKFLHTE